MEAGIIVFKVIGPVLRFIPPIYRLVAKWLNPIQYEAIAFDYDCPSIRDVQVGCEKFSVNITVKNHSGYDIFIETINVHLKNNQYRICTISEIEWVSVKSKKPHRFCFVKPISQSELNQIKEAFSTSSGFNLDIELFCESYLGKKKYLHEGLKIHLDPPR